ncbi:hypothetical protein [Rhizobium mongolense]
MITEENRHAVSTAVKHIDRAVARFGGYLMAHDCVFSRGDKDCLKRFLDREAQEIDNEFRRAAELLGYRIEKIEPEELLAGADLHAEAAE